MQLVIHSGVCGGGGQCTVKLYGLLIVRVKSTLLIVV